jgi:hypothetical protein
MPDAVVDLQEYAGRARVREHPRTELEVADPVAVLDLIPVSGEERGERRPRGRYATVTGTGRWQRFGNAGGPSTRSSSFEPAYSAWFTAFSSLLRNAIRSTSPRWAFAARATAAANTGSSAKGRRTGRVTGPSGNAASNVTFDSSRRPNARGRNTTRRLTSHGSTPCSVSVRPISASLGGSSPARKAATPASTAASNAGPSGIRRGYRQQARRAARWAESRGPLLTLCEV